MGPWRCRGTARRAPTLGARYKDPLLIASKKGDRHHSETEPVPLLAEEHLAEAPEVPEAPDIPNTRLELSHDATVDLGL